MGLREVNLWVEETLLRALPAREDEDTRAERARLLNNLGARYSALRQPDAAMAATLEAVALYRKLAEGRPDAFLPDLAVSLNNLGSSYSELRQPEAALAVTREAVEFRRVLARATGRSLARL